MFGFKTLPKKTKNGKVDASESDRRRLSRKRVEIIDSRHSSTECVFHQFKDLPVQILRFQDQEKGQRGRGER